MFVKKIPRRFLIHSVNLADVETLSGAFSDTKVIKGDCIKHVRLLTLNQQVKVTRNNENFEVNAVLIHQHGISTACEFTAGGHILFEEQLYEIVSIDKIYEAERLHHTEVKLKL